MDFINRTLDSQLIKDSFVDISISYESLSYALSTETPKMDVVSLLAEIGGNLGLFLGLSVFSLFEFIEALMEIVLNLRKLNLVSK